MNKKEELQKRYLELQELEHQIKAYQQNIIVLNQQVIEVLSLADNIESLERSNLDTKSYSAIGAGVFVESSIKNVDHLLVNVGSGILVKKGAKEAREAILKQAEDLKSMRQRVEDEMRGLILNAQRLQSEMQALAQQENGHGKV